MKRFQNFDRIGNYVSSIALSMPHGAIDKKILIHPLTNSTSLC
jgi:hypothetical protein